MTVRKVKFAHLGDIHLGYHFPYLPREKRLTRQRELRETFSGILERATREEVDLVLVSGDLVEYEMADRTLMRYINEEFARLKCPVILIAGNHDPLLPNSPYLSNCWPDNVYVIKEQGWQVLMLEELQTTVLGWSYHLPEETTRCLASLPTATHSTYRVVLAHASFSEIRSFTSPYLPVTRDEIEKLQANYLALGHYHSFQAIYGRDNRLKGCYPGSPEPLDFGETGMHGFILGEMGLEETKVRFVPVARRTYVQTEIDVSGSRTMQEVRDRILATVASENTEQVWSLVLVGAVDTDLSFDEEWLQEELKSYAFFVKVRSRVSPAYDLAQMKERPGVVAYFIDYMEGLLKQAAGKEEQARIERALVTGLDALVKGEVRKR